MFAATRRAKVLEMLHEQRSIRSEDVAQTLGVSVETVRRDLEYLDTAGELVRVHGGAVASELTGMSEPSFATRETTAADAKRAIGKACADLMSSARTIFLDIGTTAAHAARAVPKDLRATVVTPSLRVAEILTGCPGLTVLIVGGTVRSGDLAVSGNSAVEYLRDIHPDLAFLGSGGVSAERGLTDFEMAEVPVKRAVLHNSQRTFVLADSSKIGVVAPYRVCQLEAVTGIITDSGLPDAEEEKLQDTGVGVVVA